MASLKVGSLGEYIREQRRNAQFSLRQLAEAAGVSNPYLSQIERGLRKPSAEILQQIAKALRISAESLYVQAGILDERDREAVEVHSAILADPTINERQKQVLLQIYESFRKENSIAEEDGQNRPAGPPAARRKAAEGARAGAEVKETEAEGAKANAAARTSGDGAAPVKRVARQTAKKVAEKVAGRAVRHSRGPKRTAAEDGGTVRAE